MTIKEVAKLFGIKEKNGALRNKKKAVDIMGKILRCPKCGKPMKWIEGTNICSCQDCVNTVGKGDQKRTFPMYKTINDRRSRRFLENNYQYMVNADIAPNPALPKSAKTKKGE